MPVDSARCSRGKRAVIGLGSNIADRLTHLQRGLDQWRLVDGVDVPAWSRVYESEPVGGNFDGDFLNAVIVIQTILDPEQLLRACHEIEEKCGRDRSEEARTGRGNRTLDCDIIYLGDDEIELVVSETGGERAVLTIPHRMWENRAFVVIPLLDVIDKLTPHQGRLVQNVTNSRDFPPESCRLWNSVLN